jgi:hypothetical protein
MQNPDIASLRFCGGESLYALRRCLEARLESAGSLGFSSGCLDELCYPQFLIRFFRGLPCLSPGRILLQNKWFELGVDKDFDFGPFPHFDSGAALQIDIDAPGEF